MTAGRAASATVRSVAGLLAGLAVLSGCSAAATPLCDQAQLLVDDGRLADGMALYARARSQDEGDCASRGLRDAGDQYGRAAAEESRGAAAEQAGDVEGAVAAYRAAIAANGDDSRAAAGLVRLGQGGPPAPTVVLPALPAPTPPSPWWQSLWAYLGLLALALLGVAGAWRRVRRRPAPDGTAPDGTAPEPTPTAPVPTTEPVPTAEPAPATERVPTAEPMPAAEAMPTAEPMPTAGSGPAADELRRLSFALDQRDRVLDRLVAFAPPTASDREIERVFAPVPDDEPGAVRDVGGRRVVDISLLDATDGDGRSGQVAVAVRWTPPGPGAVAETVDGRGDDPMTLLHALHAGTTGWTCTTVARWLPPTVRITGFVDPGSPVVDLLRALLHGRDPRRPDDGTATGPDALDARISARPQLARLVATVADDTVSCAHVLSSPADARSELAGMALELAAELVRPPTGVGEHGPSLAVPSPSGASGGRSASSLADPR